MKPMSGRPKTMVALALALVFLLSGCPDGGSGDRGRRRLQHLQQNRRRLTRYLETPTRSARSSRWLRLRDVMRSVVLRHGSGARRASREACQLVGVWSAEMLFFA